MGSKNELLDDLQEIGEDFFVAPRILESLEVDKESIKEEAFVYEGTETWPEIPGVEDEKEEPCTLSNVRFIFLSILSFSLKKYVLTLLVFRHTNVS